MSRRGQFHGKRSRYLSLIWHDDGILWKRFPRYWPFMRGIPPTKASGAEFWRFILYAFEQIVSKQLIRRWFETQMRSLWRQCNEMIDQLNILMAFVALMIYIHIMMTSSSGNIFRVTAHLCGEFTGPRWILLTKASDAELWCFLWPASE